MSGRYNAARPRREGEAFTRFHTEGHNAYTEKNPRFDIRNPSALAPDAPEEDAVLEADVIGGGAGTKRNAVNIDGYDSDSENEGFDARARERAKNKKNKGEVDFLSAIDSYQTGSAGNGDVKPLEDDDDDMFGDLEEDLADEADAGDEKKKSVKFLDDDDIQGQISESKSGGHVSANFALDPKGKLSTHALDDQLSSDDESDAELAAVEEGIDEEVGAGGRKRNAPKVDAFNMKAEQEEGRFDAEGNYLRKAGDKDAVHDSWLEGLSKKDMRKAKEAHEKREEDRRQKLLEDDALVTSDILKTLILQLEKGETVIEALARLGRGQKKEKKIPKWKLKKQQKANDGMDVDEAESKVAEDPEQVRIKEAVNTITGAADQLMTRGQAEIYDQEREGLIRQWQRETDEQWVEPKAAEAVEAGERPVKMWEYRWVDGRDGADKQGPYDGATMTAWQDAGYFGEGVEFRREGEKEWNRVVDFL